MKKRTKPVVEEIETVVIEPDYPDRWKVVYTLNGELYSRDNFFTEQKAIEWAKQENLFNLCERNSLDIFRYTLVPAL